VADEALAVNPAWLRFLAFLSPCVYGPFYIFAIWALYTGSNSLRIPGLVFCTMMATGLLVLFVEAFWGEFPTPDRLIYTAAYGPYLLFPFVFAWRLRSEYPFTTRVETKKRA